MEVMDDGIQGDQFLKAKSRKLKGKKSSQIGSPTEVQNRKTIFKNSQLPISRLC
jgi:hypothetical protein